MRGITTITTILPLTHELKLKKSLPSGSRIPPVVVNWWQSGVRSGSKVVVRRAKLGEREVVVKRQKKFCFGVLRGYLTHPSPQVYRIKGSIPRSPRP